MGRSDVAGVDQVVELIDDDVDVEVEIFLYS